jgi:AcrR family transcriptional regulator
MTMAKGSAKATSPASTWARFGAVASSERPPLSRDEIVATAIRLIDEGGLDAFSMRRLGHELDAGATSLYWHVRNKDELVDLVVDEVIGEVLADYDAAVAPDADWRERLAEVARALRRVLLRHRHVAPLLGERPTIGPQALDAAERVMGILLDAGFDHRRTSLASGALINYASGFAIFESRSPGGAGDAPETRELADQVMAYFAALPGDRYPVMKAIAGVQISETEQFEYGLQRLLDGLVADRERPPEPSVEDGATDDGPGNALIRR